MPHVLDRCGLSLEHEPDSVPPANATEATDLFDLTISRLESALAGWYVEHLSGLSCRHFRPPRVEPGALRGATDDARRKQVN